MDAATGHLSVVPANEAGCHELQVVFGRPTLRRAVMRIDF